MHQNHCLISKFHLINKRKLCLIGEFKQNISYAKYVPIVAKKRYICLLYDTVMKLESILATIKVIKVIRYFYDCYCNWKHKNLTEFHIVKGAFKRRTQISYLEQILRYSLQKSWTNRYNTDYKLWFLLNQIIFNLLSWSSRSKNETLLNSQRNQTYRNYTLK